MALKIDDLLRVACSQNASDLHLKVGAFPVMRIGGELHPVENAPRLKQEDTLDMAFSMMSNRQKQRFKEISEVDIGYGVSGLGRFRANMWCSIFAATFMPLARAKRVSTVLAMFQPRCARPYSGK